MREHRRIGLAASGSAQSCVEGSFPIGSIQNSKGGSPDDAEGRIGGRSGSLEGHRRSSSRGVGASTITVPSIVTIP